MNIGAPPGGDAPSVEENTKMTTAAITGLTPAATSVLNATARIAVTVAVAVKDVATNMTKIPTNNATSHLSKSREFIKLPNCSGNPSCFKISLAEKEKSRMTPITLKLIVEPTKRRNHPFKVLGIVFQLITSVITLMRIGTQIIIEISSIASSPTNEGCANNSDRGPIVTNTGINIPKKMSSDCQPCFKELPRFIIFSGGTATT